MPPKQKKSPEDRSDAKSNLKPKASVKKTFEKTKQKGGKKKNDTVPTSKALAEDGGVSDDGEEPEDVADEDKTTDVEKGWKDKSLSWALIAPISFGGGKTKTEFHYLLAKILFEGHEVYSPGFKMAITPKQKAAWDRKIKCRLRNSSDFDSTITQLTAKTPQASTPYFDTLDYKDNSFFSNIGDEKSEAEGERTGSDKGIDDLVEGLADDWEKPADGPKVPLRRKQSPSSDVDMATKPAKTPAQPAISAPTPSVSSRSSKKAKTLSDKFTDVVKVEEETVQKRLELAKAKNEVEASKV
ncbi:hypothetical protein BJ138DRAFT_1107379 [Hygrophoropsis aurantiaca]|uniref:Uncharacterized protein n=1 Tax=Hygrophoropsis aurantiaca TaxID=72124 RepID=A0ACB7ZSF5_9AGAM|nr:hypothetical protein BJ138DRAFT_1107379 [Hygrophoropsis aurantiaca]